MSHYPGYVSRQELIEFCREQASMAEANKANLAKAADTPGLSEADKAVLEGSYAAENAAILALRRVTVWAADHQRPLMVERVSPTPKTGW